jgi:hypothetical protein
MKLRAVSLVFCLLFVALFAFGQVGNGTITGTITDQAGAVVAGAKIEAKNSETGVIYPAASTGTGNYTVTDLPVGTYTVTVTVMGFKTYTHSNLTVQAAGTIKEDVPLQVGANTESVTVTAEASLLKTESGELAHNVTINDMDQLPLLGIGTVNSGSSGYRNPYATLLTLPGVSNYTTSGTFQINGLGNAFSTTETMRVEGQDSTVRLFGAYDYTQMGQPGADSIQEIAYQVSNYAPEFGQAGSAVINMTMKGGTNQYHGSGYDYFVNEDLNAGDPYSISGGPGSKSGGSLGKFRPRNRRNDFGGTLGGPVYIPKIYNGHNKTFFFWSYEQYAETTLYSFSDTVPYAPYLTGNFSAISPNGTLPGQCSLCTQYTIQQTGLGNNNKDPQGNLQFANEIYNPLTRAVNPTSNLGYATPFLNNVIPATMFDPISLKLQALFPAANNPGVLIGNYNTSIQGGRYSAIPSMKVDHNLSAKDKLSFYYSENNTESQISLPLGGADGLPTSIGAYRGTFIPTFVERLNYDRTLSPTLLLHLGVGYQHTSFSDKAPVLSYNAQTQLGLGGFLTNRNFPLVNGLNNGYGGMQPTGPEAGQSTDYDEKASTTASATWVHGKHTFKFGAEVYFESTIFGTFPLVTLAQGSNSTSEPFTPGVSYGTYSTGFPYAGFLLGDYNSVSQSTPTRPREGYQTWGLYAQDSWKVTRKLTMDYGVRYDLNTVQHEQYNRLTQFGENVVNANAGNHLGGTLYCNAPGVNCYQKIYPYAFGPRIGAAYQLNPKTVLRVGWALVYQFVAAAAGGTTGVSGTNAPAGINSFVNIEGAGAVPTPTWPLTLNSTYCGVNCVNPSSVYPNFGTTTGSPQLSDSNQNRPPRVNQYSFGIQREVTRDFIIDASFVGNHAAWLPGGLGFLSELSAPDYARYGVFPIPGTGPCASNPLTACASTTYNNDADRLLIGQPINSTLVEQRMKSIGAGNSAGLLLPYTSASQTVSLANAIRPYTQFPGLEPTGSPTGDSIYNSLQIKATKRFSHNLQAGGSFTWAKSFTRAGRSDFYNPNISVWDLQNIPPRVLNFNFIYTVPKATFFNKWENQITQGWQIGMFANYQSGAFLAPPGNTINAEQLNGEDTRVAGQPLYTPGVNINNQSTYNPYFTQVLNPNAWAPCPVNTVCTATGTLYPDFRGPRQPTENANIGRNFRIKERMNFQIRGEFVNIFNRTLLPNPGTGTPNLAPVAGNTVNGVKVFTSGFGTIAAYAAPSSAPAIPFGSPGASFQPRTGTLIARFTF